MTESHQGSPGKPDSADRQGLTKGLLILAVLISFVAWWMFDRGRAALDTTPTRTDVTVAELAGFRPALYYLPDDALLGFVEVPAGQFLMGSDPAVDNQAYENERWSAQQRQGSLSLPAFYISRYEVTVAQYRAFVEATGRTVAPEALTADANHPVTYVTWTDALAYSRWLQAQLQAAPATPPEIARLLAQGWQLTLPTEAQWEKAARGTNGSIYPWGDSMLPGRANFNAASTLPVGSFQCPECRHGLADMSGNVWELTRSPYQPYPYSTEDDRANLDQDALWVMRGGAYGDGPANLRAAVRGGVDPGVRNPTIGFRLVITPADR